MKHLLVAILAIGLSFVTKEVIAQDHLPNNFYEGYIIHKDGTKEEGFILYGTMNSNSLEVIFYTDKNNRKTKKRFSSKDVKGYKVGSEEYISIRYGMVIKQQVFALINTKGHIMVLSVAEETTTNGVTKMEYVMALKKGDEEAIGTARFLQFAKQMSEYISDYEALATKVANKEEGYRLLSMLAIIDEYNAWYEANH